MNNVALITGAAKRIGKGIALRLSKKNWKIAIHYNYSSKEANELAEQISNEGFEAKIFQADLSEGANSKKLIEDICSHFGYLNCLINNASVFERDEINNISIESWDEHINSNLRSPILLTKYFEKQLPETMKGNIINIVDQRVWNLTPHFISYTLSKTGLWNFTQISALALSPRIRVNAIGPGPILPSSRQTKDDFQKQVSSTPLGIASTVDDICNAVEFIIGSNGLTGQMIALDGGAHLSWKDQELNE